MAYRTQAYQQPCPPSVCHKPYGLLLRKLQEFCFAKCSNFFLKLPIKGREPLHSWRPIKTSPRVQTRLAKEEEKGEDMEAEEMAEEVEEQEEEEGVAVEEAAK